MGSEPLARIGAGLRSGTGSSVDHAVRSLPEEYEAESGEGVGSVRRRLSDGVCSASVRLAGGDEVSSRGKSFRFVQQHDQ